MLHFLHFKYNVPKLNNPKKYVAYQNWSKTELFKIKFSTIFVCENVSKLNYWIENIGVQIKEIFCQMSPRFLHEINFGTLPPKIAKIDQIKIQSH